ncbi:hypothetical protein LZ31DRAFT_263570 [Colletotrichum somersetense]|nr:hypothetical protein LZ31DRAFT_263570 [Colletotrichum somersetense]
MDALEIANLGYQTPVDDMDLLQPGTVTCNFISSYQSIPTPLIGAPSGAALSPSLTVHPAAKLHASITTLTTIPALYPRTLPWLISPSSHLSPNAPLLTTADRHVRTDTRRFKRRRPPLGDIGIALFGPAQILLPTVGSNPIFPSTYSPTPSIATTAAKIRINSHTKLTNYCLLHPSISDPTLRFHPSDPTSTGKTVHNVHIPDYQVV